MTGFKWTRPYRRGSLQVGNRGLRSRREGDYGLPGYGPAMWWDIPAARSYATLEEELSDLWCRAQMLTQELATIQKRIAELQEVVEQTLDG